MSSIIDKLNALKTKIQSKQSGLAKTADFTKLQSVVTSIKSKVGAMRSKLEQLDKKAKDLDEAKQQIDELQKKVQAGQASDAQVIRELDSISSMVESIEANMSLIQQLQIDLDKINKDIDGSPGTSFASVVSGSLSGGYNWRKSKSKSRSKSKRTSKKSKKTRKSKLF